MKRLFYVCFCASAFFVGGCATEDNATVMREEQSSIQVSSRVNNSVGSGNTNQSTQIQESPHGHTLGQSQAQVEQSARGVSSLPANLENTQNMEKEKHADFLALANETNQFVAQHIVTDHADYSPYIIYKDAGIDKDAIKAFKDLDFGDDPNVQILADYTKLEESHDEPNLTQETRSVNPASQGHTHVQGNRNASTYTSAHHNHNITDSTSSYSFEASLKNKFGNMEECTEVILEHMLRSDLFKKKPDLVIVLGQVTNRTGDDSLPIVQIENVLKTVIAEKQSVHVIPAAIEKPADKFDYTTNILVQYADDVAGESGSSLLAEHSDSASNTRSATYDARSNTVEQEQSAPRQYTIRVQLLNYYGELLGQWSAQTSTL